MSSPASGKEEIPKLNPIRTYLKTGSSGDQILPQGLGARHQAAAAQIITEIERPHRGRPMGVEEG